MIRKHMYREIYMHVDFEKEVYHYLPDEVHTNTGAIKDIRWVPGTDKEWFYAPLPPHAAPSVDIKYLYTGQSFPASGRVQDGIVKLRANRHTTSGRVCIVYRVGTFDERIRCKWK